MKAIVNNRN